MTLLSLLVAQGVANPANLIKVRMQADGRMVSKGNMGELACYDHAKRFVVQNQISGDNIYAHTLAPIMSSLSATVLSCLADVVKT
ncbi:hypothetical protein EZV62_017849 [Acer yangbiense]|uniref:Uncharacterized protein n=1 Tax=Acer yangbiense TaxID=1000413 RepID=A0A5C7HJZ0_9ROSI|nr:hypothetical protein EZV62_017849 [Acer yangbiense]